MRKAKVEPEQLLAAIAAVADDGFCRVSQLAPHLPRLGHRDLTGLIGRAARRGLVLDRRGPDGGRYLALTSEGWRALPASR